MEVVRVSEVWQLAGVYHVRITALVEGENIPLFTEFDEIYGEETKYVLALDGEKPVGTARLHIVDERTAKIERVCVLSEYRKHGVGRKLIEAAEIWAKEEGSEKIIITSRDNAVGFYEKLGYVADYSVKLGTTPFPIIYTEKKI